LTRGPLQALEGSDQRTNHALEILNERKTYRPHRLPTALRTEHARLILECSHLRCELRSTRIDGVAYSADGLGTLNIDTNTTLENLKARGYHIALPSAKVLEFPAPQKARY
jgi:hypothetical protein